MKLFAILCLFVLAVYGVLGDSYKTHVHSEYSSVHHRLSSLKHSASKAASHCKSGAGSDTKKFWSHWKSDFKSLCSGNSKALNHWQSAASKDGNFDLTVARAGWNGWLSALGHVKSRANRCDRSASVPASVKAWPFVGDRTALSKTNAHSKRSKAVHFEHSRCHSEVSHLKKSVSKHISHCKSHAGSETKKHWDSWKSKFHSLCSAFSKKFNSWQSHALHSQSKEVTSARALHNVWLSRLAAIEDDASRCSLKTFPSGGNSVWFKPASAKKHLSGQKPKLSAKFKKLVKKAGKHAQ
jgi:hypothetical protein